MPRENRIDIESLRKEVDKKESKSFFRLLLFNGLPVLIVLAGTFYASTNLERSYSELETVKCLLKEAEFKVDSLNIYFRKISQDVDDLKGDEKKLTDFLIQLIKTSKKNSVGSEELDWDRISKCILDLPSGKRKTAVLISLLIAWKEIPFELGGSSPSASFDSPSFLKYVVEQVGIEVNKRPDEFLSVTMMKKFEKVDKPLPGDLIFYKGQTGNFGLMYLCDGHSDGQGIAVGTLQAISPLAIYETRHINTPFFPLRGYYRVNYEDYE
ncbi:MAG: NlpC/P60 family protein [Bacteroidota bacterium]